MDGMFKHKMLVVSQGHPGLVAGLCHAYTKLGGDTTIRFLDTIGLQGQALYTRFADWKGEGDGREDAPFADFIVWFIAEHVGRGKVLQ